MCLACNVGSWFIRFSKLFFGYRSICHTSLNKHAQKTSFSNLKFWRMHCWYQLIQRALSSLQVCGSAHVGHDRSQHWTTQAWFERHVLEFSKGFLWFFHEFLWFSMLFYAFEVFVSHPAERGHQCVLIAMLISHRPYGIFPGLQVRQWRRGWQAVGQGCCGTSLCSIRPGNWCFWLDLFFF